MPKPASPKRGKSGRSTGSPTWLPLTLTLLAIPLSLAFAGALALALMVLLANDRMPSLESLAEYRPKIPLRVYTSDNVLIGEFGEERRSVVHIQDVPDVMKNAILAAEDSSFFEHSGVDMKGIARAALSNFSAGGIQQVPAPSRCSWRATSSCRANAPTTARSMKSCWR